jgi:ABC-type molybdate transport system substrate-binding protein
MISANHRGQHHALQKEIIIITIIIILIIKITIIITIIIILIIIIILLLNAHLHIPWTIPVKFHYNRIKNNALTFMVTMATVAILKKFNPKFTTTHPKNIPIKFHYNRTKTFFLTFHGYHGNDGHIHMLQ